MPGAKAGISLTVKKYIIVLTENYFLQETLLFKLKMGPKEWVWR